MNYQSILNKYSNLLKYKHFKSSKLDCEILLSHALKVQREELLINLNKKINQHQYKILNIFLKKDIAKNR